MNVKISTIGAAALGLLMTTSLTRALPVAPLAPAASESSDIAKAHYSRYRHVHRHNHIVWLSGPRYSASEAREGGMSTGRSVGKHRRSKSMDQ